MAHLEAVTPYAAAAWLSRFDLVDPDGIATVESETAGADCYALRTSQGVAVFATRLQGARLWVTAAAGTTRASICPAMTAALEKIARQAGATSIGFQTARRGLVRRACGLGFHVAAKKQNGFTLEKVLS